MSSLSGTICLVGHPYAATGRGEDVRCTHRALRSVATRPTLRDIYGLIAPDADEVAEFSTSRTDTPSDINIFHINGDEVAQSLAYLSYHQRWTGYNIIYPAWELERYPEEWAAQLDNFAEIWAISRFTQDALTSVCTRPVIYMPLACEVFLSSFLSRRYFGIPESEYVFLFLFDARSYSSRKNPQAVIDAFRLLLSRRPFAKVRLVLKINGADEVPTIVSQLGEALAGISENVHLIHQAMSDNEVKNLLRCCDCFVSLHRSEGFGRGMAEAMALGKPVIATGYSGNLDFMNADVAYLVGYKLIALAKGDYPHYQGQVWAEPDWEEASYHMLALVDNPEMGRAMGKRASIHIRSQLAYRPTGLKYLSRLESIQLNQGIDRGDNQS